MKKILGITLGMVLALGLLCFPSNIRADEATGNVTIINSAPTISSVLLLNQAGDDAAIDLEVGSTVIVTATANITDPNGGETISSASATLYHNTTDSEAADDENTHITNSSCTLGDASGNDKLVTCKFTMDYMTLPGTWTVNITALDNDSAQVSGTDDNTVNTLAGLDVVETSIDFGALELGGKSSTATQMVVKSMGNVQIDAQYKGTNFTCGVGIIDVSNIKYGLDDVAYDSLTTVLSDTDVTQTAFNLGIRGVDTEDGIDSTKTEYWGIQIPATGVSGACTNTLTVTATSDS